MLNQILNLMRTKISSLFLLLSLLVYTGCGDDESGPSFVTTPEANPDNDTSGKGVYKGVLIGSSGFIKVNLDNLGDGVITLTLNLDGETYDLETEQTYNPDVGFQGYFTGAVTGGLATVGFYTNTTGTEFGFFGIEIPGHPDVSFILVKEKSSELVRCFEGTFSGSDSGIINFLVVGDEWKALARPNGGSADDEAELDGDLNGNTLVCDCDVDGDGTDDMEFTGTINGNSMSGTWADGEGSGTWSAKRTY